MQRGDWCCVVLLVFCSALQCWAQSSSERVPLSPYPVPAQGLNASRFLYWIDGTALSQSELLSVYTLNGLLTRNTPAIYVDFPTPGSPSSYSIWLNTLVDVWGVAVKPVNSTADLFRAFSRAFTNQQGSQVQGYVLCNVSDQSTLAALTLCAMHDGLVAATPDNQAQLEQAGISLAFDCRQWTTRQVLKAFNRTSLSTKSNTLQDPSKAAAYLSDWSVYGRAVSWWSEDMLSPLAFDVLSSMKGLSTVFGWGSDEGQTLKQCSRYGTYVHASDFASNLATLSSYSLPSLTQQQQQTQQDDEKDADADGSSGEGEGKSFASTPKNVNTKRRSKKMKMRKSKEAVHTVTFLMTDGDNIQWLLNNFATSTDWWASPARGSPPLGWTLSPALVDLSPATALYLYQTATANDYFVAAPSGVGYADPDLYSAKNLAAFAQLTNEYMTKSDLSLLNVIGSEYSAEAAQTLLAQPNIDGLFWYDYSSYSALNGTVSWFGGKPVIGGRFQLWSGLFDDPEQLVADLSRQAKDPSSPEGYSLIPVHVWTNTVADVLTTVRMLESEGGFEVLLPNDFVRKLVLNVAH